MTLIYTKIKLDSSSELNEETNHFFLFDANKEKDFPELHLVISHKNAKSDSKLQKTTASLSRVLPDWLFDIDVNQLVCRRYFDRNEDAKVVVKSAKDCLNKLEL